jgi:hypothetical protein
MRAICKVRGLTLLLGVGTLWRCCDGLFFEAPPFVSDALLTTLHPLLENVLQTVCRKLQEDSGTGDFDISIWLEMSRNRMGRDLDCMADVLMDMKAVPIRTSALYDSWTFQPYQEVKTACSTFSRSGWSVVRSTSLTKGGTSKKGPHRTSTNFRLGVIR